MNRVAALLLLLVALASADERAIIEGLRSPDGATRNRAQERLLALPPASRVSALRAVLREVDSEGYVWMACYQLGQLGPAAIPAVPDLIEIVYAPSERRRVAAIDALGAMGVSAWRVRGLLTELRGENSTIRRAAERALATTGVPDRPQPDPLANEPWRLEGQRLAAGAATLAELGAGLGHDHAYVRQRASRALVRRGPDGLAVLIDVLRTSSGRARLRALTALASSKDPRVIPPLLEVLRGDEGRPREIAIAALGVFQAPEAEAAMREVLRDADLALATAAIPALERIRPGASKPVFRAWFDSPDQGQVDLAFRMLSSAPACAPEFIPELIQALYTMRRNSAVDLFIKLGPKAAEAGPFLVDRRSGRDDYRLDQAIRATGAGAALADPIPESASTDELLAALRGKYWLTAGFAARRLGTVEWSDEIGRALAQALRHPKPFVIDAAFQAFRKHGAAALPALAEALENGSLEIKRRALLLLTEMGDQSAGAADAVVAALDVAELKWPAIEWIKMVGPSAAAAAPKLIRWYREADQLRGYEVALAAIGEAGAEIVPDLILELEDDKRAWSATTALRMFGPLAGRAAPALGRLVLRRYEEVPNPRSSHIVIEAIAALAYVGEPGARELIGFLKSGNADLVHLVTKVCHYYRDETPALLLTFWEMRDSENAAVRGAAADYLARPTVVRQLDKEQLGVLMAVEAPAHRKAALAAELMRRADIAEIVEAIQSGKAVLRKAALGAIKTRKQEAKPAVPALVSWLLVEPDSSTRAFVLQVICEIAGKEAQPHVVEYVRCRQGRDVVEAASRRLRGWADLEYLAGILLDDNERVRAVAGRTLSELKPKSRPWLRDALAANLLDPKRRNNHVASLLVSWGAESAPVFVKLHRSLTRSEYEFARRYLEKMGATALPALRPALKDMHPSVRVRTVYMVEKCGAAGTEDLVRALAEDEDADVRRAVVHALGTRGAKVAPILVPSLDDADGGVRKAAWAYCRQVAETPPRAIPILVRSLNDETLRSETVRRLKEVREAALPVLREAAKVGGGPWPILMLAELGEFEERTLRPILASADPAVRQRAVHLLAQLGPEAEASVQDVLVLLGSEERSDRVCAVRTLGCLGAAGRPALDRLLALDTAKDTTLRNAIAVAATRIQHPPAVLLDLLNAGQSQLTREVWEALHWGRIASLPELMELAGCEDKRIATAAISRIAFLGPDAKDAIPLLEKLSKDPDLGRSASKALGRVRPK